MKEITEPEALHRMAALCSAKEYCPSDIRKKLLRLGLSVEAGQRIIDRLCTERFIDEERFTRAFVRDKFRFNKWGKIKMSYELRSKEITPHIVETIFQEIDETTYVETLKELIRAKQKSTKGKSPQEQYAKLFRFAAGRGFESHLISSCLKEILRNYENQNIIE